MRNAQFAERQYETAFYLELAQGAPAPFVPTQPVEFYLGIDAAADPASAHAIWRILNVNVPRRTQLSPALWPSLPRRFHDVIPGRLCSLFLQFKCPVYQDDQRAKYYKRIGGSYFQVSITGHQQEVLHGLQERVGSMAVVRYAAPAFWSRADFDLYDQQRQILPNSAFVCPSRVKKHQKWMYAGALGRILLNPEPEDGSGENWESIYSSLSEVAKHQSIRDHVQSLAEAIDSDLPIRRGSDERWLSRISQYGSFSSEDLQYLVNLSTVAVAAIEADLNWVVMLAPEDGWDKVFEEDQLWRRRWPFWW